MLVNKINLSRSLTINEALYAKKHKTRLESLYEPNLKDKTNLNLVINMVKLELVSQIKKAESVIYRL